MDILPPEIKEIVIANLDLDSAGSLSCVSKPWSNSSAICRRAHGIVEVSGLLSHIPCCQLHGVFVIRGTLITSCPTDIMIGYCAVSMLRFNPAGRNRYTFRYVNGRCVEACFITRFTRGSTVTRYVYNRKIGRMLAFSRNSHETNVRVDCTTDDKYWCVLNLEFDPRTRRYSARGAKCIMTLDPNVKLISDLPLYPIIDTILEIAAKKHFGFRTG